MIELPPKPKFTKDEITNAALTVAREKGIGAVSAREVAVVLGTSTRPIFTYYHTMDELKKEVRLFAEHIFRQYVEKGLAMEPPFLGVGVQYLQFAQDEPKLYQLLYMTRPEEGQCSALEAMGRVREQVRGRLMQTYRMDGPTADRYFRDMWLAVHSLCTLTVTGNCPYSRQEVQQILTQMKAEGAEATVMFIHWGIEYQTSPNGEQQQIAQQLCDMGFDVIVGGHPHVIQPVTLLTSRLNPDQKTVCLYSTGNAVSNQRIAEMDLKTGHTEDGMLFRFTFSKYSDGTVYLESADILPCWVDLRTEPSTQYDIIPLDASLRDQWQTAFGMTAEACENAQKSYDRTEALVGAGMTQVQQYLAEQKQQREADYLAAVTETQAA